MAIAQHVSIVAPEVPVVVVKKGTIRVRVTGEVRCPGYYEVKLGSRVLDALVEAGGIWTPVADRSSITVSRLSAAGGGKLGGDFVSVDLDAILASGGLSDDSLVLRDGDIVVVHITDETCDSLIAVQEDDGKRGLTASTVADQPGDHLASMTVFFLVSVFLLVLCQR